MWKHAAVIRREKTGSGIWWTSCFMRKSTAAAAGGEDADAAGREKVKKIYVEVLGKSLYNRVMV